MRIKTYKLPFNKVQNTINYEGVKKLCSYDNLKGRPSSSQMMKRMSEEMFNKILKDLEAGKNIEITG